MPADKRVEACLLGLGTGTDNRTGISPVFHPRTGILHRYTGVHNVAVICSLSLSSYINGHSQEFDFYARFRWFLVELPRAYWQER